MRITRQYLMTARWLAILLASMLPTAGSYGFDKPYPGPFFENEQILMVLVPRAPEQMAAFYEARGFPQNAIDLITDTCFVTVHIENKSQQVIWLETGNWRLTSNGQALTIMGTDYWSQVWDKIGLPQANRSTFFWTQLPVVVDLQADEPVGGNIVVSGTAINFNIEASFMTDQDKQGKKIQLNFEQVECPKQAPGL
jgi:hypothetical protein